MATTLEREDFAPNWSVHPGETLAERLEVYGLSQAEFARRAGLTPKLVSDIIAGKNIVSSATAHAIAPVLGLSAIVWLNLQSEWSLFQARQQATPTEAEAKKFLQRLPIQDLRARGLIPDTTGVDLLEGVFRFLGIGSISAYDARCKGLAVNYRHSKSYQSSADHLFAWLQCGVARARAMNLPPYDPNRFERAVRTTLRDLTVEKPEEFWPKLIGTCKQVGVALVCEKPLTGTRLSGAAHWLDEGNPVVQLSLRHKTNDHFWWTFFHECGHVIRHPERNFADDDSASDDGRLEDEADNFALDVLVGRDRLAAFLAEKPRSEARVRAFAEEIGIHPGIVVGMLQFRKVLPWRNLNNLKDTFEWKK
jgi:HTH-type transcriptional regulator/antitoxin HigA